MPKEMRAVIILYWCFLLLQKHHVEILVVFELLRYLVDMVRVKIPRKIFGEKVVNGKSQGIYLEPYWDDFIIHYVTCERDWQLIVAKIYEDPYFFWANYHTFTEALCNNGTKFI